MKNMIKSLRLTLAFCIVLSVCYIGILWLFGRVFSPGGGNAETVTLDGQVVGAAQIGQRFTRDIYFWGRPSAAEYRADASAGSNKAVTAKDHLAQVEARIDTLLARHPYLQRKDIPAELVTASGSGLDPHITPRCAQIQIRRVAAARGMTPEQVQEIVERHIEQPFLGLFGTAKVNVLKLNVALDEAGR